MSIPSEKSLHPEGGSAGVAHGTHEVSGRELHPGGVDNVISLALSTNGQERASAELPLVENSQDPLQSPFAANKEPPKPGVKADFALREDAAHRRSKDVRTNYPAEPAVSIHDPSFDATGYQQERERLAANVRSLQGEEAAAPLPRAAQLRSVPGLASAGDGVWPPHSLEPEYLVRSRDNLRGPRTMVKIFFLIVSIFTVPMAYYFWMGGWDTISRAPTEMASFDSKSILPPPMPLSEEETTIARGGDPRTPAKGEPRTAKSSAGETVAMLQPGTPSAQDPPSSTAARALNLPQPSSQRETTIVDDPRTPAKGEPRTAKSSAGETVAMLQPGTPGAQDPHSSTAARALDLPKPSSQRETTIVRDDDPRTPAKGEPRTAKSSAGETVAMLQPGTPAGQDPPSSPVLRALDPEQIKLLMKQGEQFIAAGDVVTARIAFQRAAEAGDANAALALGATYDPTALAKLGVVGIPADVAKARGWYQKAEKLGSPDATRRIEVLAGR